VLAGDAGRVLGGVRAAGDEPPLGDVAGGVLLVGTRLWKARRSVVLPVSMRSTVAVEPPASASLAVSAVCFCGFCSWRSWPIAFSTTGSHSPSSPVVPDSASSASVSGATSADWPSAKRTRKPSFVGVTSSCSAFGSRCTKAPMLASSQQSPIGPWRSASRSGVSSANSTRGVDWMRDRPARKLAAKFGARFGAFAAGRVSPESARSASPAGVGAGASGFGVAARVRCALVSPASVSGGSS